MDIELQSKVLKLVSIPYLVLITQTSIKSNEFEFLEDGRSQSLIWF